jgi:hypothetical protein
MRRTAVTLSTLALAAAALVSATAVAPAGAAPGASRPCATRWGSTPEDRTPGSTGQLTGVRAGRHACFDRLVLDVSGGVQGWFVRYVEQVRHDGSGEVVPVRGGARLQVTVTAPPRPTDAWFREDGSLLDTSGYRTFRDLRWAGGFEGSSTVGLGVRARLPFRVHVVPGPGSGSRLVVDVAHRW